MQGNDKHGGVFSLAPWRIDTTVYRFLGGWSEQHIITVVIIQGM